jgi:hypothetical protein
LPLHLGCFIAVPSCCVIQAERVETRAERDVSALLKEGGRRIRKCYNYWIVVSCDEEGLVRF